jgi:hypothetical protein
VDRGGTLREFGSVGRRVLLLRVDVLQGHGKMHVEEVEVVDLPVLQLPAANGFDHVGFVEVVPQFRHDEEVLSLDDSLLDGSGDTFATFLLVLVDCKRSVRTLVGFDFLSRNLLQAPSKRRYPALMAS